MCIVDAPAAGCSPGGILRKSRMLLMMTEELVQLIVVMDAQGKWPLESELCSTRIVGLG